MPERAIARLKMLGLIGTPSLRSRILALVLAIVLSMGGLAVVALWQAYAAARDQVASQLVGTSRAVAQVVDREFARAEALLQGLASMPDLRDGDMSTFIANARIAGDALGLPLLAVVAPDGRRLASTTAPEQLVGQAVAPELLRVFETGRTQISNFADSNGAGPRVVVAVPVRAGRGGPVLYALGLVLPRERLTEALLEQQLPPGWVASVIDRDFTIVARTRAEATTLGQRVPAGVAADIGIRAEGLISDSFTMEGEPVVVAFAQGRFSGYRVSIGATQASFAASRRAALLRLAGLVVPVALVGAALALLLAHSLTLSLRALALPDAVSSGMREVLDLSAALAAERTARDAAEAALRDRSAWLEAAQRAGEVGVWAWDVQADTGRWSEGLAALLGLPAGAPASASYRRFRAMVLPADRAGLDAALAAVLAGAGPAEAAAEFRIRRPDGALRWMRAQGGLLPVVQDGPCMMLGACIDITARRTLETERESLLQEKEFLAGEIHHRVKNSLQIVLSLLLMQARRASPEAAAQLREAAGRVATVASVHRRLYEDNPETGGDAARYMAGLVDDLRNSLADRGAGRDLRLVAEAGLRPGLERLAPLGIVATELVTNALKYGAGTVTLRVRRIAAEMELAVEDEGPGFPLGFDPSTSRGLGMRVATTLARQSGGDLEVDRAAPGGRVVLRVPIEAPVALALTA